MDLTDFPNSTWILIGFVLGLWGFEVVYWVLRKKLGVRSVVASVFASVTVGVAVSIVLYNGATYPPVPKINAIWSGILVVFGFLFLAELYRAWVAEFCTARERALGLEGVRAWLSPLNIAVLLIVSTAVTKVWGVPFFAGLLCLLLLLLAYPLTRTLGAEADSASGLERQRVLALLESGKITVDEGARLLNALGSGDHLPGLRRQWGALAGATFILLGFCIPWMRVLPASILQQQLGKMGMSLNLGELFSGVEISDTAKVPLWGGDIPHGFGWLILLLGLSAAVLTAAPWKTLPSRFASLIPLGVGSVLLGILLDDQWHAAAPGIFVTLAGYVLLWIYFWATHEKRV